MLSCRGVIIQVKFSGTAYSVIAVARPVRNVSSSATKSTLPKVADGKRNLFFDHLRSGICYVQSQSGSA